MRSRDNRSAFRSALFHFHSPIFSCTIPPLKIPSSYTIVTEVLARCLAKSNALHPEWNFGQDTYSSTQIWLDTFEVVCALPQRHKSTIPPSQLFSLKLRLSQLSCRHPLSPFFSSLAAIYLLLMLSLPYRLSRLHGKARLHTSPLHKWAGPSVFSLELRLP